MSSCPHHNKRCPHRNKRCPGSKPGRAEANIETLKTDLARSADKISQLEKINAEMERQARLDAESAKQESARQERARQENSRQASARQESARQESARQEIERTKFTEGARLDPLLAQLQAEKAALDAKSRAWETLAYGATIAFIALLTFSLRLQLTRWRKAAKARRELAASCDDRAAAHRSACFRGLGESVRTSGARELDARDAAKGDAEPGQEIIPSRTLDRDGLVKSACANAWRARADALIVGPPPCPL